MHHVLSSLLKSSDNIDPHDIDLGISTEQLTSQLDVPDLHFEVKRARKPWRDALEIIFMSLFLPRLFFKIVIPSGSLLVL